MIEPEIVFQLVSVPPSQRELTKYCAERFAASAIDVLRLTLGADEQHAAALGDGVAHRLQRAMQHRHGLREVDDVDVVADAENVLGHLRIPAVGLVTEMNASFEQLTHGKFRKRH